MTEKTDSTSNVAEFTVSEISGALKRTVEEAFGHVRVRGEISGYRGPHSSGHAYFSLKDDKARIEAVIWRGSMSRLRFQPEEGMEVIATGKLTTYPGSSKYQIVIEQMEPAGAGALMALLEERKRRLGAEGLFDAAAKQLIPYMPHVIGVVTSPTGAVIRDIIHRITDRFPVHVIVWPVRVQGETSGMEVANAISGFNQFGGSPELPRPDVLIVARGGGSLEDLWGFNDEAVVRAVAASHIPVISAVGHETDWTLIDLAADVRAPTPTGAAEMAVPVKADLEAAVAGLGARLSSGMSRYLSRRKDTQRALARALPSADQLLALPRRHFDETAARLSRALLANTQKKRGEFDGCARLLSPRLLHRSFRERRQELAAVGNRLPRCLDVFLRDRRASYLRRAGRLTVEPIARTAMRGRHHWQQLERRQTNAIDQVLERFKQRSGELQRLMKTLSHESVLERGFALVLDAEGVPVKRAASIAIGDELLLKFQDGDVGATATGGQTEKPRPKPTPPAKKAPVPVGSQGSLF
ncbi:exodeoxyribonuclease VII large subunit [Phyllobacterium sp. 21LDTY02-6]|uniref:exodeoxyribonuclease VII large subunit n=1 Tax=Phyllobacterium sp. 21LDTY02-6 TaxID=2944903 RepID=UPI002020A169|nr:exodeoxyribonuclease VII large subunit [Phyllobacterium sp. 21LDTY02-6]MCO4318705.1 exodeoxyribonuclease VII large subunit [Phyllobacterium sp. 21LDTY02-6]